MARLRLISSVATFLVVGSAGCAHHASNAGPAPNASAPAPAKPDRDTVPDRVAAQREAAGLQQNEDDARWGVGAAQERKRREQQKKAAAQGSGSSNKAINVTGAPPPTPPPSPAATP